MFLRHIILLCVIINCDCLNTKACVSKLIETYFIPNSTINFIIDCVDMDDIPFFIENSRTVTNLSMPVKNVVTVYPNYLIYSKNTLLDNIFNKLRQSALWNVNNKQNAKVVLILTAYDEKSILGIVHKDFFNEAVIINNNILYEFNAVAQKIQINRDCNFGKVISKSLKMLKNNSYKFISISKMKKASNSPAYKAVHGILDFIENILEMKFSSLFVDEKDFLINVDERSITTVMQRLEQMYEMYEISQVYFRDEMAWYIPKPSRISAVRLILSIFTITIWICIIATFFTVCIVWCYLEHRDSKRYVTSYSKSMLNVLALSLGSSIYWSPKRTFLKILLIFYAVYCLHICSVFQGSLIRALAEPPYEERINSVEKLADSDLPIALYTSGVLLFTGRDISKGLFQKLNKKVIEIDHFNWTKLITTMSVYKNFSSFGGISVAKMYLTDDTPIDVLKHNTFLATLEAVLVMKKGNPAMSVVNLAISRIFESGLYQKIISEALREKVKIIKYPDLIFKINLNHVIGVFILWFFGLLCSTIAFCIELKQRT
ncbi:hypothetical protein RN001_004399 [Aquatica leii]|uniref:Ionotropic glutamate receptor C-terminal domain-containing protein n=1 Tax=Aquatica leii TaxID=1421715 RepID=A0AAN7P5B1_9COLE|nr:hypothetical protein RN001_004399 [Aquatica leii]